VQVFLQEISVGVAIGVAKKFPCNILIYSYLEKGYFYFK